MNSFVDRLDMTALSTRAVSFIPSLVAAILIMVGFWLLYRMTRIPMHMALDRAGMHEALVHTIVDNIYRFAVLVFALVTAAGQVGINVGAALAGIGVAGIAVGFAAQDSLANVIAGFTIFLDKPFEIGDWVKVAGQRGTVSAITIRSTRIRTPNNTYVVIPNKMIIDEVLVNHSKHGSSRVDIPIGIAYKEFIPKARQVLLAALEGLEGVLREPAPDVIVTELGDSSVNLRIRVWIQKASAEPRILSQVMEAG
ncbi:MAG: mechanosensitive ion channel family protein, partial [Acidobacteriota bacterium]